MKYNWTCEPELNYEIQRAIAYALYDSFFVEVLPFTKNIWIEDCGFICCKKSIDIPRNYEGKECKRAFVRECLRLLTDGWNNDFVSTNKEKLERYILEVDE